MKSNSYFDRLNVYLIREIFCYSSYEYTSLLNIMRVCKMFYNIVDSCYQIWETSLGSVPEAMLQVFMKKYPNYQELKDE